MENNIEYTFTNNSCRIKESNPRKEDLYVKINHYQ